MQDSLLNRLRLAAGSELFAAGEAGTAAFLIESGCLEVYLAQPAGEIVLARRGSGEIVGEMALLDNRPRSASARAVEDTVLVVISQEQIAHRIEETDPILRMCLSVILDRFRSTVAMLERQDPPEPPERNARSETPHDFNDALRTLAVEQQIKAGLGRAEFELFYQPIVALGSGRLAGFEALMRWNHPERGLVMPGDFIPIAERSGLISDLTTFALNETGRVLPELMTSALANPRGLAGPLFMSVNISGYDLSRAYFASLVTELLERTGIDPSCLKLEVTESLLMKDPERAATMLRTFRNVGMGVAIDDFGTGHSSLGYLSSLPFTTLKIDRAFVRPMLVDQTSRKVVELILRLAQELKVPVVAEGVESDAEARALTDMGCEFGQGYLFGRPAPFEATLGLIAGWQTTARRRLSA